MQRMTKDRKSDVDLNVGCRVFVVDDKLLYDDDVEEVKKTEEREMMK